MGVLWCDSTMAVNIEKIKFRRCRWDDKYQFKDLENQGKIEVKYYNNSGYN